MNVLVNAQHAIEGKGSITIRTRYCPEHRPAEAGAGIVPMVRVTVTDTGCGIAEADLQRIFDPFFTTKGVGKGTGCARMVENSRWKAPWGRARDSASTFRSEQPMPVTMGVRNERANIDR